MVGVVALLGGALWFQRNTSQAGARPSVATAPVVEASGGQRNVDSGSIRDEERFRAFEYQPAER